MIWNWDSVPPEKQSTFGSPLFLGWGALHSPTQRGGLGRLSCPLVGTGLQDLSPPLKGWELLIPLICFFFFLIGQQLWEDWASLHPSFSTQIFPANSLLVVFSSGSLSRFSSFVFLFLFNIYSLLKLTSKRLAELVSPLVPYAIFFLSLSFDRSLHLSSLHHSCLGAYEDCLGRASCSFMNWKLL